MSKLIHAGSFHAVLFDRTERLCNVVNFHARKFFFIYYVAVRPSAARWERRGGGGGGRGGARALLSLRPPRFPPRDHAEANIM